MSLARIDGQEALASLVLAAREDPVFKAKLIATLRLPRAQREPLLSTAIEEMRLRGEPADAREAFLILATDDGARTALKLLYVE
jgi:hypothetical protein